MEKKPIQAKNVVSFGDGKTVNRPKPAAPAAKPVENAAETTAETADAVGAGIVNEVSEEVPLREVPEPEAIETRPLNLRQDRYLDETPQESDWADEEDEFDDYEDADEALSTLAEVFIPLHDDTTGAIVRKGLVIVSLIVILCCIVAIVMKQNGLGGVIMPDISALTDQAAAAASIALSNL